MSSKFNEAIISKMKATFGDKGLIISSRINDLIDQKYPSVQDILQFYDLLVKPNCPITNEALKNNYLSCVLYYHSLYNLQSKKTFAMIEDKLKTNCNLNENTFFLLCNIIEFEDKYKTSQNFDKYKQLLNVLNRFQNQISSTHNLLYIYYKAVLYFLLQDYQECERETIKLVSELFEIEDENKTKKYLEISNKILTLKLKKECLSTNQGLINEYQHLLIDLSPIFQKNKNVIFSVKIFNSLADVYINKLQLKDSEQVLNKGIKLLNDAQTGAPSNVINQLFIILNLKLIYTYSLKNDADNYYNAINNLSEIIQNNCRYSNETLNQFMVNSYLMDIDNNFYQKEKNEKFLSSFTQTFFTSGQVQSYLKKYIPNVEVIYNNLFVLNYRNPFKDEFINKTKWYLQQIKEQKSDILCCNANFQINVVNIFIYLYNWISSLTYSYIADAQNKNAFKREIINLISYLVNYIHKYHSKIPSIKNNLVRKLLVSLYAVFLSLHEEKFEDFITYYNNGFISHLGLSKKEKEITGLVSKAIADNHFGKCDYQIALNLYELSLKHLDKKDEYRQGVVNYNIGICYFFLKDNKKASDFLKKSLDIFTQLRDNFLPEVDNLSKIFSIEFYEKKIENINQIFKLCCSQR